MDKRDLVIGEVYKIRICGFGVACRLDAIDKIEPSRFARNGKTTTRYRMTNLTTRREITIKSLAKFVGKV